MKRTTFWGSSINACLLVNRNKPKTTNQSNTRHKTPNYGGCPPSGNQSVPPHPKLPTSPSSHKNRVAPTKVDQNPHRETTIIFWLTNYKRKNKAHAPGCLTIGGGDLLFWGLQGNTFQLQGRRRNRDRAVSPAAIPVKRSFTVLKRVWMMMGVEMRKIGKAIVLIWKRRRLDAHLPKGWRTRCAGKLSKQPAVRLIRIMLLASQWRDREWMIKISSGYNLQNYLKKKQSVKFACVL